MASTQVESEGSRPKPATEPSANVSSTIETRLPLFDNLAERDRRIRLTAYYRYEARGCVRGYELDDWLVAEAEIDGRAEASDLGFPLH